MVAKQAEWSTSVIEQSRSHDQMMGNETLVSHLIISLQRILVKNKLKLLALDDHHDKLAAMC